MNLMIGVDMIAGPRNFVQTPGNTDRHAEH